MARQTDQDIEDQIVLLQAEAKACFITLDWNTLTISNLKIRALREILETRRAKRRSNVVRLVKKAPSNG